MIDITRRWGPRSSSLVLLAAALAACADAPGGDTPGPESGAPLAFDPATCESEPSASVLVVFGLDDGDFGVERAVVVHGTGTFTSPADAVASLHFSGPSIQLTRRLAVGPLDLWEASPSDFGAIAWIDTRINEIVFSGSVLWAGGGNSTRPPADTSVLVGGAPTAQPLLTRVPNEQLDDDALLAAVARFGVRSEVVARYTACGQPVIAAHFYTPAVGATNVAAARGLVLVAGKRATGAPL